MIRRHPASRQHFTFVQMMKIRARSEQVIAVAEPYPAPRLGWMTSSGEIIAKVYGASPAICFEPMGPQESIRRTLPVRKINRGWQKFQGMLNDDADKIHGYDDGEAEPQRRGVHPL